MGVQGSEILCGLWLFHGNRLEKQEGWGGGVRRGREWEAECWGGSKQHWYIAMETLFHQQPTAIVSQDPRNGLGAGPGRCCGSHLASSEVTSTPRTPVPLLSPFPTALTLLLPLPPPERAEFGPAEEWEEIQISKRNNQSKWKAVRQRGIIFLIALGFLSTFLDRFGPWRYICFHTPDGCRKRMSFLITEIKMEMLLPCKLSYRGKKKGCCWVHICTRPGPLQVPPSTTHVPTYP